MKLVIFAEGLGTRTFHDHVLIELESNALLTSVGSYWIVFDNIFEDRINAMFSDCLWLLGNKTKTAVWKSFKDASLVQD